VKKKLTILIPIALLLGFLAFKPPAIGSEKGDVFVTPEATVTPSTKPQLRDFDDDGVEPKHFNDHRKHDGFEDLDDGDEDHGRDHHDENDLDEDSSHEDD
jgi:hypothetical protein